MTLNEHIGYYLFVVLGLIPMTIILFIAGIDILLAEREVR